MFFFARLLVYLFIIFYVFIQFVHLFSTVSIAQVFIIVLVLQMEYQLNT